MLTFRNISNFERVNRLTYPVNRLTHDKVHKDFKFETVNRLTYRVNRLTDWNFQENNLEKNIDKLSIEILQRPQTNQYARHKNTCIII